MTRPVLTAAAAALCVAVLGGLATDLGPWYRNLEKPWFQPPDWLFAPAWTLIYAFVAASAVLSWWGAGSGRNRRVVLWLYGANALLNVLWSVLYFRLQRPDWALVEVGILWLSIAALIVVMRRHSPAAAWLLVPYIAWVTFAAALNWAVVDLNAPFP